MKKIILITALSAFISAILIITAFNRFILPIITDVCTKYAVTQINSEINKATDKVISDMNITSKDFTQNITTDDTSRVDIDSLLINNVTNRITAEISRSLNEISEIEIRLPAGAFSGIPLLSRLGYSLPFYITSMGDAKGDYDTSLTSAGVNQVSYQIWLNIECSISVTSPVFSKPLCVKRKLMLVNTIFSGSVPYGYADVNIG